MLRDSPFAENTQLRRRHRSVRRPPRKRLALSFALVSVFTLGEGCHQEPNYDGFPISVWYSRLRDTNATRRTRAAEIIADAAPDHPESVNQLLGALASETDSSVHVVLAIALGDAVSKHGPSPEVLTSLVALTRDDHQSVRLAAANALARAVNASRKNVPIDRTAVDALSTLLASTDDDSRAAAGVAMAAIALVRPADAAIFAPHLSRAVRFDPSLLVRLNALTAFSRLVASDSIGIPTYASAFRDKSPSVGAALLTGLARNPRVATALADSVAPLTHDEDLATRVLALRALAVADRHALSARVMQSLQTAAADRDSTVSIEAKSTLQKLSAAR